MNRKESEMTKKKNNDNDDHVNIVVLYMYRNGIKMIVIVNYESRINRPIHKYISIIVYEVNNFFIRFMNK